MHTIENQSDIEKILAPGGVMEVFEAAKKAEKCRFIGFTGHCDPAAHAALLKAYDEWDTVMMPIHAADHAYLSFEKRVLARPSSCDRESHQVPEVCPVPAGVRVAICGARTQGQMEDNNRTAQSSKPMTPDEITDVRKRAIVGSGVYTGPTLEYWKKPA
jgi:hypothetical protein